MSSSEQDQFPFPSDEHPSVMSNAGQKPEHASSFTRRSILRGATLFVLGGAAGIDTYIAATNYFASDDSETAEAPTTTTIPETTTTLPTPTTQEVKPVIMETIVSPDKKVDYSFEELIEYARLTDFAVPDAATVLKNIKAIRDATSLDHSKVEMQAAMLDATGVPLTFNINPSDGKELPNTRVDMDAYSYQSNMSLLYGNIAIMPKSEAHLPSGYNIIEDYLPSDTPTGPGVNTNIGGTATNDIKTNTHILSLDVGTMFDLSTVSHELTHIAQGKDDNYAKGGAFAQLRKQGLDGVDSPTGLLEMLVPLKDELEEDQYDLANTVIMNVGATPDPTWENAAYDIGAIINSGYVDKSSIPLLQYLRLKQLQAVEDMSNSIGADYAATIAYQKRFSNTHPSLLVSLADAGVTASISPLDGSILGNEENWSKNRGLSPSTHFINIGAEDAPEIMVLEANFIKPGTENIPAEGYYSMEIVPPRPSDTVDLAEPDSTTVNPDTSPYPALIDEVIGRFSPTIAFNKQYQVNMSNLRTDNNPVTPGTPRYTVTIYQDALANTAIDPSKIVGRVGDDGVFTSAQTT